MRALKYIFLCFFAALLGLLAAALAYYPPLRQKDYSPVADALFLGNLDLSQDRVNINSATLGDLMLLPGIGEQKAEAVIAYREQNGGFGSVDELERVKGIGPGILEQVREWVCC